MKRYCLDANSIITLLDQEIGFEIVKSLFLKAENGEIELFMSKVQLLEIYYDRIRVMGIEAAKERISAILSEPITIVAAISDNVLYEAGRLKTSYKMSLADTIGLATAKEQNAVFVTSDHSEMKQLETREHISFLWLPPHPKKYKHS